VSTLRPGVDLPLPGAARWQPLRMGLVDLFYYDYQEFWFRDGRLLLRGNNGTGKSKVLALTLPFLLDGRCVPARVEPDGDAQKKVEWNLLLGDRYSDRTGYAWLEFARVDETGLPRFVTIGCGMRAVRGRPLATWFFVTDQRVAGDLALLDGARTLSRERLRDALGARGEVFDQAARYRRAVDEALFQLGETRYEALLSLLLQLRQPQLSRRPDERALSRALTEALPPLDAGVLGEVAEAFRNLEAERREVDALREAAAAVDRFRGHYRRYACVAARRRGADLRHAHSRHEKASAELSRTRDEQTRAGEEEAMVVRAIDDARAGLDVARARERMLRDSPQMRSAAALHRAEVDAAEREASARTAESDRDAAGERAARAHRDRQVLTARCDIARRDVATQAHSLAQRAAQAGVAAELARLVGPLRLPDGPAIGSEADALPAAARRALHAAQQRRADQIAHLEKLLDAAQHAAQDCALAQQRWQDLSDETQRVAEDAAQAEVAAAAAACALLEASAHWMRVSHELRIVDPDAQLAQLESWCTLLEGPNPLLRAAGVHFDAVLAEFATRRAAIQAESAQLQRLHVERCAERERLAAGEDRAPPVPYTRDAAVRRTRTGAPLWMLTEFRDAIEPAQRAAIEAALEAAGLLDAWVLPDGALRDARSWDVLLLPAVGEAAPAPPGAGLDRVLIAAVDRADARAATIADATVTAVLTAIGWGESSRPAWVDGAGRWRLGPAHGAWGKPQAEYIGRGARDAARRRRLQELALEIDGLQAQIDALAATLGALDARHTRLHEELRALPDDAPLREATHRAVELARTLTAQRQRVQRAEQHLAEARAQAQRHVAQCAATAADLALPPERDELALVRAALTGFQMEAHALWPLLRHHWHGLADLAARDQDAEQAQAHHRELEHRCTHALQAARAAVASRDALRDTVGEAVAEIERRLAAAEQQVATLQQREQQLGDDKVEVARRRSAAAARVERFAQELLEVGARRRETIEALRELSRLGVLRAALPERTPQPDTDPWSADHAVRLARAIERELHDVDHGDDAWQSQQRQVMERITELQSALSRHGHEAGAQLHGEMLLVRVVFQARACDAEELAGLLAVEERERAELLDAKERDLLEQHLVNELANHLQLRIQDAELAAGRMNAELARRPTGTGMKLRLRWQPLADAESWLGHAAPDGLNEARRRLLRQSSAVWSPQDRRAVGTFLKKCIDDARIAQEGAALPDVLERALDYRYWHRFIVERWQDGAWRAGYGPASGGERALVATIPLFAAASSHYASAGVHAPRLVLLDEAFAGVDDASRAKCLGLLASFDMDVVMTSEREWGCYPEVPGLAIAHLTRREGVDAVHVSTWWWDGAQRVRAEQVFPDLESAQRASMSA